LDAGKKDNFNYKIKLRKLRKEKIKVKLIKRKMPGGLRAYGVKGSCLLIL